MTSFLRILRASAVALAGCTAAVCGERAERVADITVACYYFGNYHDDDPPT